MKTAPLELSFGHGTHPGKKRDSNQDNYVVLGRDDLDGILDNLIIVADGMGGGRGGGIASAIVVEESPEAIRDIVSEHRSASGPLEIESLLRSTITRINGTVWQQQAAKSDLRGMGTTCVLAGFHNDSVTVAHCGDSRAYLLRGDTLTQLTEDHSEVWQQVRAGNMTPDEARKSRYRNVITRAVGIRADVTADVRTVELHDGDTLLICSDGLTTELADIDIARILATEETAQSASTELLEGALRAGGSDNITAVVVRAGTFVPLELIDDTETQPEPIRQPARTPAPAPARAAGREAKSRSLQTALTALLFVIALVEGLALLQLRMASRPTRHSMQGADRGAAGANPTQPVPGAQHFPADYGPIDWIQTPLLKAGTLEALGDDLLVATQEGKYLRIRPDGAVSTVKWLDAAPGNRVISDDAVAADAAGCVYRANNETASIEKYDPSGNQLTAEIGDGRLKHVTAIAAHRLGDLYVIDRGLLKRLRVASATVSIMPEAGGPRAGRPRRAATGTRP